MKSLRIGLWFIVMAGSAAGAQAQVLAQSPQTGMHKAYNEDSLEANEAALGVGFSASYDDNALTTPIQNGQGLFSITPRASWNITKTYWSSVFDYNGLISKSSRFDFYDRSNNTFNTSFNYRATSRLSLLISDNFIRAVDPLFSAGAESGVSPGGGGVANPSYFGNPALRTSDGVQAEADYQLDAHTTFNVSGNYYFQRYSEIPNASLRDSNSVVGQAAYHHELSARTTAGLSYDVTKITTKIGYATLSQRIMATGEYAFKPSMVLTVFGGPNHISNAFAINVNNTIKYEDNASWSWSAGGTYTWIVARMNMSATAARQISDGGGLSGTVRLTSFEYRIKRKLTRNYSAAAHATYTLNNRLIPQTAGFVNANYGSAGGEISRQFHRDVTVKVAYDRMEQLLGEYAGNPWIDRDRVTISINYQFTHPLGR